MIHANRAREIADKFDPVSDREDRLLAIKATISAHIMEAAREGRYEIYTSLLYDDIIEEIIGYLRKDCGYTVTQESDPTWPDFITVSWA